MREALEYHAVTILPSWMRIVRRVRARLRAGSILILHDGSPLPYADRRQTVAALEVILRDASAAGLRAVTVRELLAQVPNAGTAPVPDEVGRRCALVIAGLCAGALILALVNAVRRMQKRLG